MKQWIAIELFQLLVLIPTRCTAKMPAKVIENKNVQRCINMFFCMGLFLILNDHNVPIFNHLLYIHKINKSTLSRFQNKIVRRSFAL